MVTMLKPRRRKPEDTPADISSENLPANPDVAADRDTGAIKGIELDADDDAGGTGSAPGEGPNPTA